MNQKPKTLETIPNYNLTIQGRHVLVTDAMKDYVIEKLAKLERFSTNIIDVVVTMDIQKQEHRIDISMKFNHIKIKVQASSDNMYASIDKAIDKLQSQFRRYKEKIRDHQTKPRSDIDMNVNVIRRPAESEIDDYNEEIAIQASSVDKLYQPHEVVRKESRPLKQLTHDEAVMKIELSGDRFLIYRSEEDRRIKVIYRMSDDNYGIIEVE